MQRAAVATALSEIVAATRHRLGPLRKRRRELELEAARTPPGPEWAAAFGHPDVSVVAEIKRRSPSAGAIAPGLDPARHARAYEAGGARAVSVLTEERFFGGSLADLQTVRGAVGLPVLRKDFILDPVQLFESRAAGASAVLLVARILGGTLLAELAALARELGLGTLVEVHTWAELESVLPLEPELVGVNSRDLETFRVDVAGCEAIVRAVPRDIVAMAESGLRSRADVERVADWGAGAVLVGTEVARADDPEAVVEAMTGVPRRADR